MQKTDDLTYWHCVTESKYFAAVASADCRNAELALDKKLVADHLYLLRKRRGIRMQHAGGRRLTLGQRHRFAHGKRTVNTADKARRMRVAAAKLNT